MENRNTTNHRKRYNYGLPRQIWPHGGVESSKGTPGTRVYQRYQQESTESHQTLSHSSARKSQ